MIKLLPLLHHLQEPLTAHLLLLTPRLLHETRHLWRLLTVEKLLLNGRCAFASGIMHAHAIHTGGLALLSELVQGLLLLRRQLLTVI